MTPTSKIKKTHSLTTRMLIVVLGLYLIIVTVVTAAHVWAEYHYQKAAIVGDMQSIGNAYMGALAVGLWGLDEESVKATVEGMMMTPPILGVSIKSENGKLIAVGGK